MKKKFFKKLLAATLVCSFAIPNVAFAQNLNVSSYTITEDSIEKDVVDIDNGIKLISWENENEIVFEEYRKDILVNHIVVDKLTNTAISYMDDSKPVTLEIPINRSSNLVESKASSTQLIDTVKASNTITSENKSMKIYENSSSGLATDYVLPNTVKYLAELATQLVINLGVGRVVANNIVSVLISMGLCWLVDKVYELSSETVRAIRYELDYYGQDKNTSKKSDILEGGRKYMVTSGSKINEIFYEGLTYEDSSNKIANMLANNLYGSDFKVY